MRKRRGRSEISEETLDSEEKSGDFFACYLLASLSPRHKGHSYIGFTVNPRRRIRQHNGDITCGAWRTKSKRPWEMVLCIYGFPTNVSALQFEWAWQHPTESLAVRKAAASFKSLSGIANKIKMAYTMLTLPSWQDLNLTVNFFSTKYTKHSAGCPSLPEQMRVQVCVMDELPCYSGIDQCVFDNEDDWGETEGGHGERGCSSGSSDGVDHQFSTEEVNLEQAGWNGGDGRRQPRDSPSPEVDNSKDSGNDEEFGRTQENTRKQPTSRPTGEEDERQLFCLIDSPVRTSSFITEGTLKDEDISVPSEATMAADRAKPKNTSVNFCGEIEVIDLLSSTPICGINSRKKRRAASTEIIDLTKSPSFVQL